MTEQMAFTAEFDPLVESFCEMWNTPAGKQGSGVDGADADRVRVVVIQAPRPDG
jgi:hypothetical protein